MVARDLQIARHEGIGLHLCHISAAESVAEIRRAKELGVEITAEVSPHHLCLTDEAVRGLDPATSKMNPPLRGGLRPGGADRGAGGRHARLHRHRPRAAPGRREGAAVRGGAERRDRPRDGVPGGLHPPGRARAGAAVDGDRADVRRPGPAFGLPVPALREGARANLALWSLGESRLVAPPYVSRSRNCAFAGQTLQGRCTLTIADGAVAHRLVEAVR